MGTKEKRKKLVDAVKEKSSKFKHKIASLSEKVQDLRIGLEYHQKKKLKTTRTEVKAKITVKINVAKSDMKRLKKKRTNAKIKEKNEKTVQQKKRRVFEAATEKKAKEDRK